MNDIQSLSHSKWRCLYHIVFVPKCRRNEIYGKIGQILRKLCEQKCVEIVEAEACPDLHPHASVHTAQFEWNAIHGILEREEQSK